MSGSEHTIITAIDNESQVNLKKSQYGLEIQIPPKQASKYVSRIIIIFDARFYHLPS